MTRSKPATPPMTPPAIAPVLVDLVESLLDVIAGFVLFQGILVGSMPWCDSKYSRWTASLRGSSNTCLCAIRLEDGD